MQVIRLIYVKIDYIFKLIIYLMADERFTLNTVQYNFSKL